MTDLDRFIAGAEIAAAATSRRIGREFHQQDVAAVIAGYAAAARLLAPRLAKEMLNADDTRGTGTDG